MILIHKHRPTDKSLLKTQPIILLLCFLMDFLGAFIPDYNTEVAQSTKQPKPCSDDPAVPIHHIHISVKEEKGSDQLAVCNSHNSLSSHSPAVSLSRRCTQALSVSSSTDISRSEKAKPGCTSSICKSELLASILTF